MFYINSVSLRKGPFVQPLRDIAYTENINYDESFFSLNGIERSVACLPEWSVKTKVDWLKECILEACNNIDIHVEAIDFIFFCCTLPTTHFPMGASIVHNVFKEIHLHPPPHLYLGGHQCTGFIASIEHAIRYFSGHRYKNILLLTLDCVDFTSKRTLQPGVTQGDGASALIVSKKPFGFKIRGSLIKSNFQMYDLSGSDSDSTWKYFFTMRSLVQSLLDRCSVKMDNIAYLLPHISSIESWNKMCNLIKFKGTMLLKEEMNTVGHLFGSDLPLGLQQLLKSIKPRQLALALTYGIGSSWGSLLLEGSDEI